MIIAENLEDPFYRLHTSSILKTKEKKQKLAEKLEKEIKFKPKLNNKSEKIDKQYQYKKSNLSTIPRWEQLYIMVKFKIRI